jgi:transaldolase/glucose-6-phosphate isomerase
MTQAPVDGRLRDWQQSGFARRLWNRDHTLWSPVPTPELTDRLGWLDLPETMAVELHGLSAFAAEIRATGMRNVVLLGMGGSSLAPEVFQHTFGNAPGSPELIVLDSTHPGAVAAVDARIDPRHTLFLVSSKSGTTIETLSLFRYFWQRTRARSARPGEHFVAITDPGTPLVRLAGERAFRRVFLAPADVGGRYSALTVFGLVPAALIGVDVRGVLERARRMSVACGPAVPSHENPGLTLGAILGEMAVAGRDKLTLLASPSLASLPSWIEQLVAESTGKDGTGIVPVVEEPPDPPGAYGADRVFVHLRLEGGGGDALDGAGGALDAQIGALESAGHPVVRITLRDAADLGAEFFRWEVATAAAGTVLGIHPFNQPDVQLAKDLAQQAMAKASAAVARPADTPAAGEVSVTDPAALAGALAAWLAQVRPGDYVGLQAFLAPSEQIHRALQRIRMILRDRLRVATTAGYGPRFLHSTGQLHKGGPETGVFLQIVDESVDDLAVPETDYTFGALIRAQGLGDLQALRQRGRRVLRITLGRDVGSGLARMAHILEER